MKANVSRLYKDILKCIEFFDNLQSHDTVSKLGLIIQKTNQIYTPLYIHLESTDFCHNVFDCLQAIIFCIAVTTQIN